MNGMSLALLGAIAAAGALVSVDAGAATIRVQCEQRGTQRSKISVDGQNLAALPAGQFYKAQAVSGASVATSPGERLHSDEVEADFDSDRGDIANGAVAVAPSFIVDGTVTGKILAPDGTTVISDTVACRVRSR